MLSSKTWMCSLIAAGLLLAASTHSMAQSGSRYSNSTTQRVNTRAAQRSFQSAGYEQTETVPAQAHVAQAYVPQHIQNGIQTGVVAPTQQTTPAPTARVAQAGSASRQIIGGSPQVISGAPIYDNVIGSSIASPVIGPSIGPVVGPVVGPGIGPIVEGPIVGSHVMVGGSGISSHTISTGCSTCPSGSCGTGFGGPVDLIGGSYFSEGCGGCGDIGCGIDDCCGRGACPPSILQDYWLNGIFGTLSGAEFFVGGAGFRSETFQVAPGSFDDASFGFQGGFNVGVPLCRLTGGLLSGQFGVRHITSSLDGNSFSDDNRNQTFFTAGLFRRVDYGLQIGVVADVLREEWFTDSQTVQLRGDFAWVYPRGSAFGFRFTSELDDDFSDGTINGVDFTDLRTTTVDTYRFYYRHGASWGGFFEVSAGWAEESFLVALDHDIPVSETISLQSNLTYLSGDDLPADLPFAANGDEAWNLSVGIAWRPRGRCWYRSYNTPVLPVADNGTLIQRRGF